MSTILPEVLAANASYAASFGAKGTLALPPARRFAVLTCMDARLDPAKFAGLSEGDAHIIRDPVMRALLAQSLQTAELTADGFRDVGKGPGSAEAQFVDWLTIANTAQAVVDDVARIRHHPLVPRSIPIHGYLYEVKTGRLLEIDAATKVGQAA